MTSHDDDDARIGVPTAGLAALARPRRVNDDPDLELRPGETELADRRKRRSISPP